tara:strand:+ start:657 stop:1184 length:528 start_codon:yes stop_codon:yes gene_type:complete
MNNVNELKRKKIRHKLRYLQTELEETKIIYKQCLEKFNADFSSYLSGGTPTPTTKPEKDPFEKIQTEVEEDTFRKVYRKVAGKTHPDKKDGDEDKFKKANEANRNKDFGALLEMADEMDLEVPIDDEMIIEIEKQIQAIIDTTTKIKTTWAWTWIHIDKGSKDNFRKFILQQLGI